MPNPVCQASISRAIAGRSKGGISAIASTGMKASAGNLPTEGMGQIERVSNRASLSDLSAVDALPPTLDGAFATLMSAYPMPLNLTGMSGIHRLIRNIEDTRDAAGTLSPSGCAMLDQAHRLLDASVAISAQARADIERPHVAGTAREQLNVLDACAEGAGGADDGVRIGMQYVHLTVEEAQGSRTATAANAARLERTFDLRDGVEFLESWTDRVLCETDKRMSHLKQTLDAAPLSATHVYQMKALMGRAALACIRDRIHLTDTTEAQRRVLANALHLFEARVATMNEASRAFEGVVGKPEQIVGSFSRTGLAALLAPFRHLAERFARWRYARALLKHGAPIRIDTPGSNEYAILHASIGRLLRNAGLSTHTLKRELAHHLSVQIDTNPLWSARIEKDIHAIVPPGSRAAARLVVSERFKSEIKPAHVFFDAYKDVGVSSQRTIGPLHAVNLAQTCLTGPDGEPLFSAVRHGVLSAFSITPAGLKHAPEHAIKTLIDNLVNAGGARVAAIMDPDEPGGLGAIEHDDLRLGKLRELTNQTQALEVVALSVMGDQALCDAAEQANLGLVSVPRVDLLSLSLLTPDPLRGKYNENERAMLSEQDDAWKLIGGNQTLEIRKPGTDQTVRLTVNVNPIAMNYGVNRGAIGGTGPLSSSSNLISGWDLSSKLNDVAMSKLFGSDLANIGQSRLGLLGSKILALEEKERAAYKAHKVHEVHEVREVHEAMQSSAPDARAMAEQAYEAAHDRANQARELQRQIGEIHASRSYMHAGNEVYKMPTRLAVLAELLGVKVAFNCKSGKDRTGMLDAQIKHMKIQIALTGEVPRPDRVRTRAEKDELYKVVINSGNLDMQRLNTGFAGYKLKHMDSLYKEFGAKGKRDRRTLEVLGLSEFTKS